MKLNALSTEAIAKIQAAKCDRILEKHEGPDRWSSLLNYLEPEFLQVDGAWVLLPIPQSHHANLTILRTIWNGDRTVLTIFLKDTTYSQDWFDSGYLAICEQIKGEAFLLATVYHEWFIIEQHEGVFKTQID
ncbi:MAG: hypothetical protein F6J87_13365 [Spirulina sp. SIO3F2]|nr:hypothetical protein [Spirulina sp. SIO3F2]